MIQYGIHVLLAFGTGMQLYQVYTAACCNGIDAPDIPHRIVKDTRHEDGRRLVADDGAAKNQQYNTI